MGSGFLDTRFQVGLVVILNVLDAECLPGIPVDVDHSIKAIVVTSLLEYLFLVHFRGIWNGSLGSIVYDPKIVKLDPHQKLNLDFVSLGLPGSSDIWPVLAAESADL